MTDFRTKGKGKDRTTYPIKKRQPYGISKTLAYDDVKKLRGDGKRARLIETNRRLDLYAPYESELPSKEQTTKEPENIKAALSPNLTRQQKDTKPAEESREKTYDGKYPPEKLGLKALPGGDLGMDQVLAITNEKGNPNMTKAVRKLFFEGQGPQIVKLENGIVTFSTFDAARVAGIREIFRANMEGKYADAVMLGDQLALQPATTDAGNNALKFPKMPFRDDSWDTFLEGENLTKLYKTLKDLPSDSIQIQLVGKGRTITEFSFRDSDDDGNVTKKVLLKTPSEPRTKAQEGARVSISTEYLRYVLQAMVGRHNLNKSESTVSMTLVEDYPLQMKTSRHVEQNDVSVEALIAPRIE